MKQSKIVTKLSAALVLFGSLSTLQAVGVSFEHSGSSDVGGSVSHNGWIDVEHNWYVGDHYRYDADAKIARYPLHNKEVRPVYEHGGEFDTRHGTAVSVQFNPDKSGDVVVDSFELRDHRGHRVAARVASENLNDRQFAIVADHRLDWDAEYSVSVSYKEDGTPREERWTFRTQKLDHPVYTLEDNQHTHYVARNSTYAFYDKHARAEADGRFEHHGDFRVEKSVDHDTFYARVDAEVGSNVDVEINDEKHKFHIFTDEIKKLEFSNVDDSFVTLKWYHDRSGEEKGYKIYRDGKFLARVDADVTVYRDTSVKSGATYTYTVKVTNDRS